MTAPSAVVRSAYSRYPDLTKGSGSFEPSQENPAIAYFDAIRVDAQIAVQPGAVGKAEALSMKRTHHHAGADQTVGQRSARMRTARIQREDAVVALPE